MVDQVRLPSRMDVGGGGMTRLRQLDALRVITCFSVIAFHAVSGPYPVDDPHLGVATSLLHYGREVFFFVSAVVLVRSYMPRLGPDGRLPDEASLRRRRLRLIGVPYLLWTAIYLMIWVWHVRDAEPAAQLARDLPLRWVYLLATGNGSYHLYFLLVTIQVAAVFPVFLGILRRTQGNHHWLLAGSLAVQVGTLLIYHLVFLPSEGWRAVVGDSSLLAYQFWLFAGGVTALHLERIHDWVMSHQPLVLTSVPLGATALLANYWAQVPVLGVPRASTPLQPMMILWSTIMLAALYLSAVHLTRVRCPLLQRAVTHLAQLSFGIYLAHPMVLDLVLSLARRLDLFSPSPWLAAIAFLFTSLGTVLLCAAIHSTRYSLALIGRGQRRRRARQVLPTSCPSPAST